MPKFAENTSVAAERSRAEIERILARYGATGFMYGWSAEHATVAFDMNARRVMFRLPMPASDDREFTHTPSRGTRRSAAQIEAAYDQAVRQRWRALALVIKAKLEAVESGITLFEEEFLAHIVLPNGQTVGHWMLPQVEQAYSRGTMPPLLPAPK